MGDGNGQCDSALCLNGVVFVFFALWVLWSMVLALGTLVGAFGHLKFEMPLMPLMPLMQSFCSIVCGLMC